MFNTQAHCISLSPVSALSSPPDARSLQADIGGAHQLELQLFERVDQFRSNPPERALWRELLALVITQTAAFVVHQRRITPAVVHHIALAIYFRVNEAGIAHVTHHQLAKDCRISKPVVTAGITVLQRLGVIQVRRTNRREAAFIEMNIGGLSWSAIRRRARLFHQNRVTQKQQPRLPFAAASGNRGLPLSGNRELPPKGYVQELISDQSAVAERDRARGSDENQQQQFSHPADRLLGHIAAASRRIEGVIGYLATTSRKSNIPFDEDQVREDLEAGRKTVEDLQRQAGELRLAATAEASEAAAARALERSGGYAAAFKCGACETMQYPEPGGRCPGCGKAMRW